MWPRERSMMLFTVFYGLCGLGVIGYALGAVVDHVNATLAKV